MAVTALFPLKAGKRSVSAALGRTTTYVKNPAKTDGGEWVSAYECDPLTVDAEFAFSKSQYAKITGRNQGSHDVIAYHLRQAFKPGEIDAETANEIGYKLAWGVHRLYGGAKRSEVFGIPLEFDRQCLLNWRHLS